MDPLTMIAIINALSSVVQEGVKLYNNSETVLSQTDAQAIHEALLKAEAATKALRPQVDAALSAAAARG
jgi:hypothetical protein